MSLVLDLRIAHDRFGSSSDPNLNGHLYYPNDIDRSLNETAGDKIRKYRSDYNNSPPNAISFMTVISSTSGRLHSEFVRLLYLQDHRETNRFFASSGFQLAQFDRGHFHFHRTVFSSQLRSSVGNILDKTATLRITLKLDRAPITSKSHTHTSYSQTSRLLTSSLSQVRSSSPPIHPVYSRDINSSVLVFSLSSHRHSYIGLIFRSLFIDS